MPEVHTTSPIRRAGRIDDSNDDVVLGRDLSTQNQEDRVPLLQREIQRTRSPSHNNSYHATSSFQMRDGRTEDTRHTDGNETEETLPVNDDHDMGYTLQRLKHVTMLCVKAWFTVIFRLWTASIVVCFLYMLARRLPPGRRLTNQMGQSFSRDMMVAIEPINPELMDHKAPSNVLQGKSWSDILFGSFVRSSSSAKLAVPALFGSVLESPIVSPIFFLDNVTGCKPLRVNLPKLSDAQFELWKEKKDDFEVLSGLSTTRKSVIRVVKSKREEVDAEVELSKANAGPDGKSKEKISHVQDLDHVQGKQDVVTESSSKEKSPSSSAASSKIVSESKRIGEADPEKAASSSIQEAREHISKENSPHMPLFFKVNSSSGTAANPLGNSKASDEKEFYRTKNTTSEKIKVRNDVPWIALIKRGGCSFDEKVLNVERAGFSGVIVYNDRTLAENGQDIPVRMSSFMFGGFIHAYSMFLTQDAGHSLISTAKNLSDGDSLIATFSPREWYLLPGHVSVGGAVSDMIYLLSVVCFCGTTFLVLCFFLTIIRNFLFYGAFYSIETLFEGCHLILTPPPPPSAPVPPKLTIIPFPIRVIAEENESRHETCNSSSPGSATTKSSFSSFHDCCAICLDEFQVGDSVRDLPCRHSFHSTCLDPWLLGHNRLCPTCKRDVLDTPPQPSQQSSVSSPVSEAQQA